MNSKQDGYSPRTAADLERKYNFGKSFAEIYNLASDARNAAVEAKNAYEGLSQNEIFNLLTDFGKSQGVYRDDTGNVYINASYIKAGKLGAEFIDVAKLKVSGNLATKGDIPDTSGFITNDITDTNYVGKTGITEIIGGVVTTDFIKALGIFSDVAYINGKLTVGQLPDNVATKGDIPDVSGFATKGDIPDVSGFLKNDVADAFDKNGVLVEYSKMTGITEIVGGVITTDYVNALEGVHASTLVSTGSNYWQTVSIADGQVQFYSGGIWDGTAGGIGTGLNISSEILSFHSGSYFRFCMPGGYEWELSSNGMYLLQYGSTVGWLNFVPYP